MVIRDAGGYFTPLLNGAFVRRSGGLMTGLELSLLQLPLRSPVVFWNRFGAISHASVTVLSTRLQCFGSGGIALAFWDALLCHPC